MTILTEIEMTITVSLHVTNFNQRKLNSVPFSHPLPCNEHFNGWTSENLIERYRNNHKAQTIYFGKHFNILIIFIFHSHHDTSSMVFILHSHHDTSSMACNRLQFPHAATMNNCLKKGGRQIVVCDCAVQMPEVRVVFVFPCFRDQSAAS